jgi:hypothetical protein
MGIEFINKSTEEIKKRLMKLLEDKKGRTNLIIQLGSPLEFQKLQNIRVAIDEINSAALDIILSSKEAEASRSLVEEESRCSRADENRKYSFANVLVIMHLSTHSIELKKLNTLPGLNFWFGWELRVIEKLDMSSVDVEIKRNLCRPLKFHQLFVLNEEDKKKINENTRQCEIGLRELQMTILGRLLFHKYHSFVRYLVRSNAYLNLSSFNLGEVKRNLLPEMNGQEKIKEGYFLRVFEQEMSSRTLTDKTSQEWTKYLSQNTETKSNELREGDEVKSEDNETVYVDIEKAISTAFELENGSKIQAYLMYLMCPEHLNNLSAYILGCSNKVEGLNGPHDELIEMFTTLEDHEFLDYIKDNHLDKYKDILGADENEWYEKIRAEFKNTLKNPIYDFQMSLKAFLNNEENKFVSFSLKGKSIIKPTTYKLPIYKENYEQIQKIVKEFKDKKKFLFSYDFKDVKRIIKLYKNGNNESMKPDSTTTDSYQVEMNNFKNNEKLVNLIFDPETTKENLPRWMIKGVYTEQTKEFYFEMFLDLIKTLFPDPTRPYSDQEYYAVFELITLCLREPSKEEAESPLFFFKGIFFAFEFLNSILKNIMMNIHNNDTELEYLKSTLKNLLEGQIKKPESQKKKSKGQENNADPKQDKQTEPFSFILLDEMSTKVELRNLISNGIDIQKLQEKEPKKEPKKKNLMGLKKKDPTVTLVTLEVIVPKNFKSLITTKRTQFNELSQYTGPFITILEMLLSFDTTTQISVFDEIKERHQKELNSGDNTGGEVFTGALLKRGRELFPDFISKIKQESNEKLHMKNVYLIKSFIDVWGTYEHLDYFLKDKRFNYVFSKELYGGKGASILRIALTERFASDLRDLECTIDGKLYNWVDLQHKNAEAERREREARDMHEQEYQDVIEYRRIRAEIQQSDAFKTYNSTVSFMMANFEENKSIIITLMDSIWKSALSTRRKIQQEGRRLEFDRDILYSVVSELDPNKLCGNVEMKQRPGSEENEIPQNDQIEALRELDSSLPLNTILNITMMRILFSKEKLAELKSQDFEQIETLFREKLTSLNDMSSTLINSSTNYGLIYLMQCFVTHETSIAKLSSKCETVKKLEDSLSVKAGESNIVFFDLKIIEYYKQLLNEVDALVEKCLKIEAEVPNLLLLMNREYQGSRSMNMYVLGVICINKFIKKEGELSEFERAKRGNYQKVFSKCSQKSPQTPDISSYLQIIDHILTGNIMRRYSDWIDDIGEDQKESMNLLLVKLFSQFSILVACFPEMNYKLDAWKQSQETRKLPQNGLCCKMVNTNILNQFVACLETIIGERLNGKDYRDWYGRDGTLYVKNLGCYRCSCKYMYTVNNCGYNMKSFRCPWCKLVIGGVDHKMVERPGHLHVKTFPEINDMILEEYNAHVANYAPHYPLNNQSDAYRSMRVLEVGYNKLIEYKDKFSENPLLFVNFENDLYLRHLMDHIFIVSSRNFVKSQEFQLYDSVLQEALNLKDIDFYKDFSPERYFMRHINNDLEKLNGLLKFSTPMERFDWLKVTFSTMAENMFQKVPADKDSKLFIQRNLFSEATQFINQQDAINAQMSKDVTLTDESIVQILMNRKQLFERKDAMAVLESRPEVVKSLYILNTLCRHEVLPNDVFPYLKDILDQIEPSRVELLRMVLRYEHILRDYPKFMEVHLSLAIFMRNKYGRNLSFEDTFSAQFEPELRDENLKWAYSNFVAIWNKMEGYRDSLPELFDFSDMCAANINVPEFIDRVTKKDEAKLKDFLIFSKTDPRTQDASLLYFRSIIGSFVKNFHNKVSKQASLILKDAGEDSEGENGEKITLEEATYSDFVYLDTARIPVMGKGLQDKAIEELVLENCMFDITRANEIVFDTHKIQLILAKALYKPEILAEESNFKPFEFEFSGSYQKSRETAETILKSLKTESRSDVALLQEYLKDRFPDKSSKDKDIIEVVEKLFLFILDMIEFLKVRLDLEDLTQTIESKMNGQQKETYFRYENLQKEFKDLKLEGIAWTVGDLPQLYEEVLEKAVDSLVKYRLRAKKIGEVEAKKISSLFVDEKGNKNGSDMMTQLEKAIKVKARDYYPDMRFADLQIKTLEGDCESINGNDNSKNKDCFDEIKDYRIDQFGCLMDILK